MRWELCYPRRRPILQQFFRLSRGHRAAVSAKGLPEDFVTSQLGTCTWYIPASSFMQKPVLSGRFARLPCDFASGANCLGRENQAGRGRGKEICRCISQEYPTSTYLDPHQPTKESSSGKTNCRCRAVTQQQTKTQGKQSLQWWVGTKNKCTSPFSGS